VPKIVLDFNRKSAYTTVEGWERVMKRKQKELPKVRNPFVLHLSKRPSGAHGKNKKAERRAARVSLLKDF
jgi:hypothetical protein